MVATVVLFDRLTRAVRDRRGVTAVEYGIVAAFLCLALVSIFKSFGTTLTALFTRVSTGL